MSWKKLLAENKIHTHSTSKKELGALRALITRDLADAAVKELSDDRRFAILRQSLVATMPKHLPSEQRRYLSVEKSFRQRLGSLQKSSCFRQRRGAHCGVHRNLEQTISDALPFYFLLTQPNAGKFRTVPDLYDLRTLRFEFGLASKRRRGWLPPSFF
jgi:hypothetical protein